MAQTTARVEPPRRIEAEGPRVTRMKVKHDAVADTGGEGQWMDKRRMATGNPKTTVTLINRYTRAHTRADSERARTVRPLGVT